MYQASETCRVIRLDKQGGGAPVAWDSVIRDGLPAGLNWVHLDWSNPSAHALLVENFGVDEVVAEALVEEDTRPRSLKAGDDELIILRGVNMTPGAEPEDMISLRILANADRVITLLRRDLQSVRDVRDAVERGEGPGTAGQFVAQLVSAIVDRVGPVISQLEDAIDQEEDDLIEGQISKTESDLTAVRGRIVKLRRFLAPQREALLRLLHEKVPWLDADDRARIRESADQLTRYIEDLDAFRERGQLIQEEIGIHVNRRLTRNTFIITLGAFVLVPLNIVTGLMGMNVGGIPGKDSEYAFWVIASLFVMVIGGAFWFGRRRLRD